MEKGRDLCNLLHNIAFHITGLHAVIRNVQGVVQTRVRKFNESKLKRVLAQGRN